VRDSSISHQGGDSSAAFARELNRHPPDASRRAGDENALAEDEADDLERTKGREPGRRQRRSLHVGHLVGDDGELGRRSRGELGPGPGTHEPDDACAYRRPTAVAGGSFDDACHVPPRHRARRQRGEIEDLAPVERERPYADERLVAQGFALRDFGERHIRRDRCRRQGKHGRTSCARAG
jgi:hypothetical protein